MVHKEGGLWTKSLVVPRWKLHLIFFFAVHCGNLCCTRLSQDINPDFNEPLMHLGFRHWQFSSTVCHPDKHYLVCGASSGR